jgi:hypothetical protein
MNSTCDQIEFLLSMRIDGESLSQAQEQFLKKHLAGCQKCRRQIADLQAVDQSIKKALTQKFNAHIDTDVMGVWIDRGQMDEVDRSYVQSHLKTCPLCQARLRYMRHLQSIKSKFRIDTEALRESKLSRFFNAFKASLDGLYGALKSYFHLKIPRWATAVTVVACLIMIVALIRETVSNREKHLLTDSQKTPQSVIPRHKEPEENESSQDLHENRGITSQPYLAANFKPLPYMEEMIQSNYRSRGIQIFSPAVGSVYKSSEKIEFKWKSQDAMLTLKIITNKGNMIKTITTHERYILQEHLPPWLYYWKLENEQDLLYVGKIVVQD